MAELAAAEARAAAAEDEVETLREALAACAQPAGATGAGAKAIIWSPSVTSSLVAAGGAAELVAEAAARHTGSSSSCSSIA